MIRKMHSQASERDSIRFEIVERKHGTGERESRVERAEYCRVA